MESLFGKVSTQAIILPKSEQDKRQTQERREKVLKFSENCDSICEEIYSRMVVEVKKRGIEVGNFKIVWVGGRIQDKPFKNDTDVDLLFCVDRNGECLNEDTDFGETFRKQILAIAKKYELNIDEDRMIFDDFFIDHIWNYELFIKVQQERLNNSKLYVLLLDKCIN